MVIESVSSTIVIYVTNQKLAVYHTMYIVCGCHGSQFPHPFCGDYEYLPRLYLPSKCLALEDRGYSLVSLEYPHPRSEQSTTYDLVMLRNTDERSKPWRVHYNNWQQCYLTRCELLHGTYSYARGTIDMIRLHPTWVHEMVRWYKLDIYNIWCSIGVSLSCEYNA